MNGHIEHPITDHNRLFDFEIDEDDDELVDARQPPANRWNAL